MKRLGWLVAMATLVLSSCNKPAAPGAGSASAAPAGSAATPDATTAPPVSNSPAPAATSAAAAKTYRVPAGTRISVRTEETIDSSRASDGQTFSAEIARDVAGEDGQIAIPRGANGRIVVKSVSQGGHIRGASDLILDLASVTVVGQRYRLNTTDVVERGKDGIGANRRTAKFAGSGAAIGAVIGAIAGGGKGAAIGAGSGAGAGAVGEIVTKGRSVRVPAESMLTFELESPLEIVAE